MGGLTYEIPSWGVGRTSFEKVLGESERLEDE